MAQIEVPITLDDNISIHGVLDVFKNFATIVATAVNLVHKRYEDRVKIDDSDFEAVGAVKACEEIAETISKMLPVEDAAHSD